MNRPIMSKYKILLMDADNTLLDFSKAEEQALCDVFSAHGVCSQELLPQVIRKFSAVNDALWKRLERKEITREYIFAHRFKDTFEFFGFRYSAEMGIEGDYFDRICFQHQLIDGAEEVCRRLSETYDMYITTNGTMRAQTQRLGECGLLPYFKGAFISQEIGFDKPSKSYFDRVFQAVFEKSGHTDKSSVLVVGDSFSSDIQGAVNAEVDGCWYNPKGKSAPAGSEDIILKSRLSGRDIYEIGSLEELLAK